MQYTYLKDQTFQEKRALLPFLRRIMRYATAYRKQFTVFMLAIVLLAISDAIFPLIWMYYIDNIVTPSVTRYAEAIQANQIAPAWQWKEWIPFGAFFLLNGFIQVLCVYLFVKYAGFIEQRVTYDLRRQMFVRLQQLSFSFYDRSASGWLLSRLSSDTPRVTRLISWSFLECAWGILMIIGSFSAMFYYKWQLALIILLSIPLLMLISVRLRLLILKYSRFARKLNSEMTAQFTEHINGVEVNKITAQEDRTAREFSVLTGELRHASFHAAFYTALYMPVITFIGATALAMVLYKGGYMALLPQGMSVGLLAAFTSYASMIYWPVMEITRFYAEAQGSLSAGERIFSLIDEKPEIIDQPNASDFGRIEGDIHFQNVSFAYVKEKPILQNFNLHIEAGQSLAIVGATGGGKSTIINLVCRFYEPSEGKLLIDGMDYTQKTIASLRQQLGVVLQTPHLFSGTLRENIRYGKNNANDQAITNVLEMLGAKEFSSRLDEIIEEGGNNLSEGEKQIISFARALLTNPRILIMDEATASIDSLTEEKIQQGIGQMIQGRTALIIAHRLSTIKSCKRIIVIHKGTIIEDGTHQQLMQQKGYYYQLYTKQMEEEIVQKFSNSPTMAVVSES